MTLTEARRTLERYRDTVDGELAEAVETAINALPRESGRLSAEERLRQIRETLAEARGIDPFGVRKRGWENVTLRQCAWILLRNEGYTTSEIGKACGYDHATVYMGVARLKGYLASGDRPSIAVWRDFMTIIGKSG